jgi:precorrin-8X/cobalt-precorrin-8 methylmutase
MTLDHPIFSESIRQIRLLLAEQAELLAGLTPLERDVLERCIHSSGDPAIAADLRFTPGACAAGAAALAAGTPILTDTAMAAAAVAPMARRTFGNRVTCVLDWAPAAAPEGSTRTAAAMAVALAELAPGAVVLIGSAPTALEVLLEQVAGGGEQAPPGCEWPGPHRARGLQGWSRTGGRGLQCPAAGGLASGGERPVRLSRVARRAG